MIRVLFFSLLILFLICSCGTFHIVKINSDGSAFVQSDSYRNDSLKLVKSSIISDFKIDYFYNFKISTVDSLGQYMGDIISDNYITFKYYSDSLVIVSNNNNPLKVDHWSCCGYNLQIESEKKINNVFTKGKKIRAKNKKENSVLIFWDANLRKQIKNRVKKVIIEF